MKDTGITTENNTDFILLENSEALKDELLVFRNIKAGHKNRVGTIVSKGELDFDVNNGIDLEILINEQDSRIKSYMIKQILSYYSDYVTKIVKFEVTRNNRTLSIYFEYVTIWGNTDSIATGGVIL